MDVRISDFRTPPPPGSSPQEVLRHYDGTHGVFWDWASLMQHSPLPGGPRRTETEQQLFVEGLGATPEEAGGLLAIPSVVARACVFGAGALEGVIKARGVLGC